MEQQSSHPSLPEAAALSTGAHTAILPRDSPSWPGNMPLGQQIHEIELFKQQLRTYADDFATERKHRERSQAEKEKLREELNTVKDQVQILERQVCIGIEENSLLLWPLFDGQVKNTCTL